MAKCNKLQRTITKVCSGSLNKRIELYTRQLTAPINAYQNEVDYTETFVLLASVWSMIKLNRGVTIFDGVNTANNNTTDFYIRYRSDVTAETWIVYNNKRYKILEVSNLDENSFYLMLRTKESGLEDRQAAEA